MLTMGDEVTDERAAFKGRQEADGSGVPPTVLAAAMSKVAGNEFASDSFSHSMRAIAKEVATAVHVAYLALPVEQRMEAMGMERGFVSLDGQDEDGIGGGYVFDAHPMGLYWREANQ